MEAEAVIVTIAGHPRHTSYQPTNYQPSAVSHQLSEVGPATESGMP